MAFPTVAEMVTSETLPGDTVHPVSIPAGLEPGSVLLLVEFCHGNLDLDSHPVGFELLYHAPPTTFSGNVNIQIMGYIFKPAELPILGVERGDRGAVPGGTITLTTSASRRSVVQAIAFAEKTDELQLGYFSFAQSTGGATNIDPPNLAYSGSAKDVLWWAIGHGIGWDVNGYPANFNLYQSLQSHIASVRNGTAICARELNATSEDPGVWPDAGGPTSDWYGVTMAAALNGP